jgi:glycosyltransferase involved in cell wall biosynthesis
VDARLNGATDRGPAGVTVGIPTRNRSRLLRRAIASVLGQSFSHFTLVVSDNASDDDTADVVASFRDPRVVYRPLDRAVDRHANFNRLIELADSEFLLALGDDDELHPEHLALTVEALRRRPTVGVVHTAYEIVDQHDNPLESAVRSPGAAGSPGIEPGREFIERSMREGPTVCLSSAVFRRAALLGAGGWRSEDGVIDDLPLLMRVANDWDFAYLDRPLAVLRAHSGADSSALGSFTPNGFRSSRSLPDVIHEHRRNFIVQANLPKSEARRLVRIAERTHRRDVIRHLSTRAITGDRSPVMFRALGRELRRDPRLWLDPITWRFIVGQLGGRRLRDSLRRARSAAPAAR